MPKIAPSILSGDHGNLSAEAARLEKWGADWIHVDIMDATFAPNLTFGPGVVKALRKSTKLPLDCHLMLSHPEQYAERFLDAGGDIVTVHAEAVNESTLAQIEETVKRHHARLGIAFKPNTPLDQLDLSAHEVSVIVVMTVNPGFSGQKFMTEVVPKVSKAARLFSDKHVEIEVDGGVDMENAKMLCEKGATVLVAGNSIFGKPDPKIAITELKRIVGGN
ncbi:MAG: ribulose-phosphate 3-epimerase [Thaumarchaeota archaeon]|nr:ribulose-phosphate 3-epimerase [Nitrososphaerota archaeon]